MRDSTKDAARRHTTVPDRADMQQIEAMPALLDTMQAARIVGTTPLMVARKCAEGAYPAVKAGRGWRINKARFLQVVGLS